MPYRVRVLAFLFLLILVMYLDRLCIAVAGPRMQHEMGLSPSQWGWVIGAFTLSYAAFQIPIGMLGDRLGARKVLSWIVLWWSVFTAATGAAPGLRSLLLIRFLFGFGEAGSFPNCASVMSRWIPKAERARAASVIWMATASAGALTPLIVVWIQKRYGWRVSFYAFGSLGIFWSAIWYWWFRDTPALKSGVTAQERELIGTRAESREPLPWSKLLRDGNFIRLLLMYHTYCWGGYFSLSWLPTYLQVGRGLTEDQMKIASALPAVTGLLGLIGGGWISDRLARRHSLRVARSFVGAAGLFTAGLTFAVATVTRNNAWAVFLLTFGIGAMNLMLPVSWSICVDMAREHAGGVSGAMNTAGQIGSLISSVAYGYMVEWFGSYDYALMPLAAMLLISGALFASINPSRELAVAPPEYVTT